MMKSPVKKEKEAKTILEELEAWFESYTESFLRGDEAFDHNIEIKLNHTRRVRKEIADLAASLDLAPEETALAEAMALLHDVGRFEQYDRYGTYADRQSEDHAKLGIRVLENHRVLVGFERSKRDLISKCIGFHNRLHIPEGQTEDCLFYSRLLRDADKLDIWRVITDYYTAENEPRNPTLELDLPSSTEISEDIAADLLHGRLCDAKSLRTSADFKVLQMSWIFDVNYPRTFEIVYERQYLEKIARSLPETETAASIYRHVRGYLDARL